MSKIIPGHVLVVARHARTVRFANVCECMLADAGFGDAKDLKQDLSVLLSDFKSLETDNDTLNEKINTQKAKIQELMDQVERNKGDRYAIIKLQKEAGTLRSIMQSYVHTIDSLNTLNVKLIGEIKDTKTNTGY